jgi:phosphoribosylformylglycinamidine synthase
MTRIGTTGGDAVRGAGFNVSVAALKEANESFFRDWMDGGALDASDLSGN